MALIDPRRIHALSLGSFSIIAEHLSRALTPKLAAYICDFRDPKALARYSTNEQSPRPELEQRMRLVYQVITTLMAGGLSPQGVQAWFTGLNPDLDDHSPADVLRSGDEKGRREVLNAARAHAEARDIDPPPSGEVVAPKRTSERG